MSESQFPYRAPFMSNVVELIERTKWCHQNIGDWLIHWCHLYDPERKVYWYCFSTEEDLAYFQLACC